MKTSFFDNPSDMEPLLPPDRNSSLAALGWQIVRRAERLGAALHPVTARGLAATLRVMNSYYSHLIEGHQTRPAELEAALRRDFGPERRRGEIQWLHAAHLRTQESMEEIMLNSKPDITNPVFLQALHREFYDALPPKLRTLPEQEHGIIEPGAWREFNVSVSRHLAPKHGSVRKFMDRFHEVYERQVGDSGTSLVACAAAHHRLAWIHPFADGNGRVARLFSQAWVLQAGVDAHGLWSLSRGLARRLGDYRSALSTADEKRRHDTDGRGYLSTAGLEEFCRFFLETCLDQLDYMSGCLALETFVRRVEGWAELQAAQGALPRGSQHVLREVCLRGEVARGEAARALGKSARTAQTVVGSLLESGCLTSPSAKGVLRLGYPREALSAWVPGLFGVA